MALPEIIKDIEARIIRPTSTDNAIVRFDGTTGQVQNSTPLIDDNGKITVPRMIHSNSVSTDTNLSRIPSETEIAFETGNNNGSQSVWLWRENWATSNYGVFHDNSADVLHAVGGGSSKFQINLNNGNTGIHGNLTVDGNAQIEGTTTLNNKLTVNHLMSIGASYDSASSHIGIIDITNTITAPSTEYFSSLSMFAPNLQAGHNHLFMFGKERSQKNSGYIGFRWNGNSSNENFITLGLYGVDKVLNITGAGNVGIGTVSPSYKLHVNGTVYGTTVYGAVWNDYAEFRNYKDSDKIPYGRVVIENGDDSLSLSTERLQLGGNICSDTFGFAIGETDNAKLPIAVSGRVLAYTNEPRDTYKPGEALCSGPNGTVSKMTREEIKEYPDAIIGYVSAVPDYEIWGTGNVKVDGRIWIKVK